jgi:hypothetical protein
VTADKSRWLVDFEFDAFVDLEDVKSRGDRKAVVNVINKLRQFGPELPSPHMKSLRGEPNLFELRPKQGASAVRPIYARIGNCFVVLAVSPNKASFERAVAAARRRLSQRQKR